MKVQTSPYERAINHLSRGNKFERALADELEKRVRADMADVARERAALAATAEPHGCDECMGGPACRNDAATAEPATKGTRLTPAEMDELAGYPLDHALMDRFRPAGPATSCSSCFERGLPCPCEVASREAREAKERAPSHPMTGTELNQYDVDEPATPHTHRGVAFDAATCPWCSAPTYSADDLRKVAVAVGSMQWALSAIPLKLSDLDAIIAKAVGP